MFMLSELIVEVYLLLPWGRVSVQTCPVQCCVLSFSADISLLCMKAGGRVSTLEGVQLHDFEVCAPMHVSTCVPAKALKRHAWIWDKWANLHVTFINSRLLCVRCHWLWGLFSAELFRYAFPLSSKPVVHVNMKLVPLYPADLCVCMLVLPITANQPLQTHLRTIRVAWGCGVVLSQRDMKVFSCVVSHSFFWLHRRCSVGSICIHALKYLLFNGWKCQKTNKNCST